MTKQEEIREGIIESLDLLFKKHNYAYSQREIDDCADEIMSKEASQGVVIKSKNQNVPITFGGILKDNKDIFRVEPLIKLEEGADNNEQAFFKRGKVTRGGS